jgi:CheY-like chemotaxis protein
MPTASNRSTSGRILIVDDNDLGLMARKSVLKELGHEIVTLSTPQDALVMCAKQKFDLIVTDFKMPQMNGVEFIRQLRSQNLMVPVILISGFTDTLGLSEENTGADAVIQKSSNEVSHLIRSVNRLLRKPPKKPASSEGAMKQPKQRTSE